jgi:formiminotetrahydrofolate cyclodeaminase
VSADIPTEADTLRAWTDAIAAPTPAPAGGAAAALSAALAAAAVEMVAGMTAARERYAAAHQLAAGARERAAGHRVDLVALAARDAEAFAEFGRALALPRATDAERAARDTAKRAALRTGAELQLTLLAGASELAELAARLAEQGLASALGDAAAGAFLAAAAARSAYWAARANLQDAGDDADARRGLEEGLALLERAEAAEWRVRQLLSERVR